MEISIRTSTIVEEVRQKVHFNTRSIADNEARLNARAGEEQMDEVERCILEANARVKSLCSRWLACENYDMSTDDLGLPDSFVYNFIFSMRKASNKADSMAQIIHAFIIADSLARYFKTVSQADLATLYENKSLVLIEDLNRLIHSKLPPL